MVKKRKLSGLSGLELQLAYDALLRLKNSIQFVFEEVDEQAGPSESLEESFDVQISTMLSLMSSRLEGPQSLSFSTMGKEELEKMKIQRTGLLSLKKNSKERVATTVSLGQNKFWSSVNLYNHLNVLENLVSRENEASARAWIDTFFFRASAMLPADKRMVLNMEYVVPSTSINPSSLVAVAGIVDYTAVVASESNADLYLRNHEFEMLLSLKSSSIFIMEAKHSDPLKHVPQAICEMYACGKLLQKKVIRGASEIEGGLSEVSSPWPDYIAAILSHWIENSSADLQSDDWYEIKEE